MDRFLKLPMPLFDVLWVVALMFYVLAGVRAVPFHGDESTLIYMSRDYYYQFIDGDLSRIVYDPDVRESDDPDAPTQQELRLLNGTVHKYLVGFLAYTSGYGIDDLNKQWLWGADWEYNLNNGHIPSDGLLFVARMASAVLLALSIGVAFGIGLTLDGRVVAYIFSLLVAINPVILLNGRRAMMEGSLLLFSLLTVLAAMHFLRHRDMRWGLVLGLSAGMAVSSKHTGVITVVAVFGVCGVMLLWSWWKSKQFPRKAFAALVGGGMLSLLVFIVLNPAWWANPLGVVRAVLPLRGELLQGQVDFFGGYPNFGEQIISFARQALFDIPQYFESKEFSLYISDQIDTYENSLVSGVALVTTVPAAILTLLVIFAGRWRLFSGEELTKEARQVLGAWLVVVSAATMLITPLEWQRYYLPAIPAFAVMIALGVSQVWMWARKQAPERLRQRMGASEADS